MGSIWKESLKVRSLTLMFHQMLLPWMALNSARSSNWGIHLLHNQILMDNLIRITQQFRTIYKMLNSKVGTRVDLVFLRVQTWMQYSRSICSNSISSNNSKLFRTWFSYSRWAISNSISSNNSGKCQETSIKWFQVVHQIW